MGSYASIPLENFPSTVPKPVKVLLVEDDPSDVELTIETLKDSKLVINLNVVKDGAEALAYLKREAPYVDAIRPDLILLDLNLPKKDGREVLCEIKNDDTLKLIPVVILTTSSADEDIVKSYNYGANCYITKPVGLDQFARVVKTIENFWFTIVKLPPR